MSNYKLGCIEEAKRWDRISNMPQGGSLSKSAEASRYASNVAARWREKAAAAK